MALGFGFNKTKVMAAAEKAVQTGKLQNAITEYEKVVKEDPKDLTVLNTIGDLYARVGNNDRATAYFKTVGDIYATEGFTVKAIAVYKKIAKLNPGATDCIVKLAELYTQQGLYNDARSQYVAVAETYMKANDLEDAARIFQKILELDSENTAMQSKLADLYMKLGRRDDARNIFLKAAQALYQRAALDAADEALRKVVNIDPGNVDALLLRGKIAADSGDGAGALGYLEKIPGVESKPDAMRAMITGYLQTNRLDKAEGLADALLSKHNDPSGMNAYAEALVVSGQVEPALKVYDKYYEKLLAVSPASTIQALLGSMNKIAESVEALELLRGIFVKAGEHSRINEVNEALAHACVQAGQLQKAAALYKELADLEPENPLHLQNYKQVQAKLGKDPTVREISAEAGGQALMVDELEHRTAAIEQDYPGPIREAIKAALTEAELFESYSMPMKAIAPLEAVLPKAPNNIQINQRLASLYARSGRIQDAIQCCKVIEKAYLDSGHPEESAKYNDMAQRYQERIDSAAKVASVEYDASFMPAQEIAEPGVSKLREPVAGFRDEADKAPMTAGAPAPAQPAAEFEVAAQPVAAPVQERGDAPATMAEFDIQMTAHPGEVPAPGVSAAHEIDLSEWEQMTSVESATPPAAAAQPAPAVAGTAELVQEIEFYLSQSMWKEAGTSLQKMQQLVPNAAELPGLQRRLQAGLASIAPPPVVEEIPVPPQPAEEMGTVAEFSIDALQPAVPTPAPTPAPVVEEKPAPPPPAKPVAPAPPAAAKPAAAAKKESLDEFVLELDESLGEDFSLATPAKPIPAPGKPAAAPPPPAPAAAHAAAKGAPAKAAPPPPAPAVPAPAPVPMSASADASATLSDMFAEFKEGVEESTDQAEDPDTHYNLGVAFKEMGLLDEAIGELQKVCHAIDKGHPFNQVMQAYTWLAHCFLEKGVPEASVKWYEKALHVPSIDEESRLAVYYELGSAHEAAGNKKAALQNFNEVYSNNIDYRDVAERIKALRS